MFENLLILHCSPTLARLKTGNLFSCEYNSFDNLSETVAHWNDMLSTKGVFVCLLCKLEHRALIYVYRPNKLKLDLQDPYAKKFLCEIGYDCTDIDSMLQLLAFRISLRHDFPHEIGLFLGYPIDDVVGFIKHKGKNCKCSGYWKVYSDEISAKKLFQKYNHCTDVYRRKLTEGTSILRLTIAA